jgi:hypothetical protein
MTGIDRDDFFYLWAASAWVGLAVGFIFFRVLAIVLASPLIAPLSAALLYHHGFGLVRALSISMGSLAALQSLYLLGAAMGHAAMNDE